MRIIVLLVIVFNIIFPKAGTKIGNIPIYIGSILVAIIAPLLLYKIFKKALKRGKKEKNFIILTGVISILGIIVPLVLNYKEINSYTPLIISMYAIWLYPVYYFLPLYYPNENYSKILKISLIIILSYAYVQKIFGDYDVVIPGLSANYFEATQPNFLEQKNNMLYNLKILKSTSTYQNGNLLGLNLTLIFWTILNYFKEKIWILMFYFPIIILTGSASTYIANIIIIVLILTYKIFITSRINKKNIMYLCIFSFLIVGLIIIFCGKDDNIIFEILRKRLFERNIIAGGGRIENLKHQVEQLKYLKDYLLGISLLSTDTNEMIFANTFFRYGIVGIILLTFRLILFFNYKIKLSFYIGILAYFINSLFDSAINYPPVYFNYFFILGFIELENRKRISYEKDSNNTRLACELWGS